MTVIGKIVKFQVLDFMKQWVSIFPAFSVMPSTVYDNAKPCSFIGNITILCNYDT
jgi:hypothetical protein